MPYSPITIKNPDGSERVQMPFAKPCINLEQDYLDSLQKEHQPKILPVYNQAAHHQPSLRNSWIKTIYRTYVEPAILLFSYLPR